MLTFIPQEEILINWSSISETLGKFWDTTINFETLPSLKKKLLAEQCQLWLWSNHDSSARLLFVTYIDIKATAKILTVTHTAGINPSGKRHSRKELAEMISEVFDELEDAARVMYLDGVCIHARPAHVKLAKGYKKMTQPIVKIFDKGVN